MTLINKTKNNPISTNLREAKTFTSRLVGLLGKTNLVENEGLWIHNTNSIHTYFMRFTIDAVFIDRNFVVKKCFSRLKPWRLTWPVWSAHSVLELPAGTIEKLNIEKGDVLSVLH